jgi:hypothetical protein
MRVGPRIRILRPGETKGEEDKTSGEEEIATRVELGHLGHETTSIFSLLLCFRRIIGDEDEEASCKILGHGDPVVSPEAVLGRIAGSVESSTDQQSKDATEIIGSHVECLAPRAPSSRENFRYDSMKKRLNAIGDTDNAESGNSHVHRICAGDDYGSDSTEESNHREQPLASPVISSL